MNYPLIHVESTRLFNSWDQLRLWLVQKHCIARPENAEDLPEILIGLGVVEYVQPDPEPSEPYIPQSISMRQTRLYLYDLDEGITLQAVENYALTMSVKAQIEWSTSHEVWRTSPMVEQMRLMFGWSVEQMDQMFIEADKL